MMLRESLSVVCVLVAFAALAAAPACAAIMPVTFVGASGSLSPGATVDGDLLLGLTDTSSADVSPLGDLLTPGSFELNSATLTSISTVQGPVDQAGLRGEITSPGDEPTTGNKTVAPENVFVNDWADLPPGTPAGLDLNNGSSNEIHYGADPADTGGPGWPPARAWRPRNLGHSSCGRCCSGAPARHSTVGGGLGRLAGSYKCPSRESRGQTRRSVTERRNTRVH